MHDSPTLGRRLAGPALLLAGGLLRWADGRDGEIGGEPWWTLGNVAYLGAVVALVALVAGVRRIAQRRASVTVALGAAVAGGLAVAGLIAGEISSRADDKLAPLGGILEVLSILLVLGVVGAWAALATAHQVSWLEPALATAGFAVVLVDLDLAMVAAALLASAVARSPDRVTQSCQPA